MNIELHLTAKKIYEKEFKRSRAKGYSEDDVNDYLDLIIEDYMKIDKLMTKVKELEIENQNLKIKIEALKNVQKEEPVKQITNLDMIKRLARLEQAVFGSSDINE